MTDKQDSWIATGYELVALAGYKELKIEALAKKVGISKSSFYHHFADIELFTERLLNEHIRRCHLIAEKERQAKNINPEFINILVDHKTDLLFNRQLRINRNHRPFATCIDKSNQIIGNAFVILWMKELDLRLNQQQAEGFFELALENFYLQISDETLNHAWLTNYFSNLKRIACNFG